MKNMIVCCSCVSKLRECLIHCFCVATRHFDTTSDDPLEFAPATTDTEFFWQNTYHNEFSFQRLKLYEVRVSKEIAPDYDARISNFTKACWSNSDEMVETCHQLLDRRHRKHQTKKTKNLVGAHKEKMSKFAFNTFNAKGLRSKDWWIMNYQWNYYDQYFGMVYNYK